MAVSFSISDRPIDCAALAGEMQNAAAGAFVSFEGWVRNSNEGHDVTALEYEVFHELAVSEGRRILDEAVARFGLLGARAVHREGRLAIGDCAVWVGVTARHRGEAFAGCRAIIDDIKHRLPIWKKEHYVGLEPQWVNCQHQAKPEVTAADYYVRQVRLPEIGGAGQAKLAAVKILIVGVGGLGSAAALSLAAAGIGTIGLADFDVLDVSNLHRQLIYSAADVGKPKVELAAERLRALNPLIEMTPLAVRVATENAAALFADYDLVLDCTDNFAAKYALNDAAVGLGKPLVQASIYRFEGQLMMIDGAGDGGCLRCLFPEPTAAGAVGDCAEVGVLGTVSALFGTLQANEAIKYVLGLEVSSDLLMFDLLSLESRRIVRRRDLACAVCSTRHPRAVGDPAKNGRRDDGALPDPCLRGDDDIDIVVQSADTGHALRDRYKFIDVREEWEVLAAPVEGALHMPTSAFDIAILDAPKDSPLLLICAKGVRSRKAAEYLRGQGWRQAYSLVGGAGALPR